MNERLKEFVMNRTYEVKLPEFQGPLDLLLHLINELEIDIYDVPVAEITDQYLQYIHTMQTIELNIASEYLVMAATLIEMKSAMLLPKHEPVYEDTYEEDPREQLMLRLIEYRKFKEAANHLQEQELQENEIYTRPPFSFSDEVLDKVENYVDVSLFDMIGALQKVFKRKKLRAPLDTTINRVEISVEERMTEIEAILEKGKAPILFDDLFSTPSKQHIVSTFLAILQLLKNGKIQCTQTAHFQPIYVHKMEE